MKLKEERAQNDRATVSKSNETTWFPASHHQTWPCRKLGKTTGFDPGWPQKKKKDSQTTHTPTVHTELSHTRLDIVGGLQWTGVRQSAAVAGESHCKHTLGYGAAPGPWQTSDEGTHTLICVFKHSPAQTVGHQRSGALPCLTICQSPSHSQPTHKSTDRCFSYSGIKKSPEQQWDFSLIHLSWEATL